MSAQAYPSELLAHIAHIAYLVIAQDSVPCFMMRMEQRRPYILDRRPLYPEIVAVGVPRGYAAKLKARARAEGTTVAALARQAFERLLSAPPHSTSGVH